MALAPVAQNLDHSGDHVATAHVRREMEFRGYTKLATTISLRSLVQKGLITGEMRGDYQDDDYYGYELTESGWQWIVANKDSFVLSRPREAVKERPKPTTGFDDMDDDIPL